MVENNGRGESISVPSALSEVLAASRLSDIVEVSILEIRDSGSPRVRGLDLAHVNTLAQVSTPLPPVVIHRETMTLIDGAHRYHAAIRRGASSIAGRFFDGDRRMAFVLSVALNGAHGLPLSLGDRRAAARRMLIECGDWSDRRIAAVVGLSDKTVGAVRRRVLRENGVSPSAGATAESPQSPRRPIGSDGVVRPIDCSAGRKTAARLFTENPTASAREVAARAGISVTTAKDVRRRLRARTDPVQPRTGKPASLKGTRRYLRMANGQEAGALDRESAIRRLVSDPSVRYTESGRTLLRLMERSMLEDRAWESIAENVPLHSVPAILALAEFFARDWDRFVVLLNERVLTEMGDGPTQHPGALA